MVEKQLIVSGLAYTYSGTYSMKKLETTIQEIMLLKGYSEDNLEHYIKATEEGKSQTVKYTFSKRTSEYDKSIIIVKVITQNVIPVKVKISGRLEDRQKGKLRVEFRGEVRSNREGFIGYRPWSYFWQIIASKFITSKANPPVGTDIEPTIKAVYDELWLFTRGEKIG